MSNLGFGVGYRQVHFQDFIECGGPPPVDWVEIISENFMHIGGVPRQRLEWLQERFPIVMHGVSLSIAGTDPLDQNYLEALRELADRLNPPLISDHLCWTNTHGRQLHDLLPFPYTKKNLLHIAERVDHVQQFLGRRLLLENPTAYVAFRDDEMPEAEFLAALADQTGSGILLDINNLYVNQCNLGVDPGMYLELLSPDMVAQFHLAGHSSMDGLRIDTHDQPVCDEVWDLYRLAAQRYPNASSMVEWDDQIPSFDCLMQEVRTARRIHHEATQPYKPNDPPGYSRQPFEERTSPTELRNFQRIFSDHVTAKEAADASELLARTRPTPATNRAGLSVYRQAYFLRIRDALRESLPTLHYIVEDAGFDRIIADYLHSTALRHPSLDRAGQALPAFLREQGITFDAGVPAALLADLVELDITLAEAFLAQDQPAKRAEDFGRLRPEQWETLRLNFVPSARLLRLGSDPTAVWQAARANSPEPPSPAFTAVDLLIYRETNGSSLFVPLDNFEANIMQDFMRGDPFPVVCENWLQEERDVANILSHISQWVARGILRA